MTTLWRRVNKTQRRDHTMEKGQQDTETVGKIQRHDNALKTFDRTEM